MTLRREFSHDAAENVIYNKKEKKRKKLLLSLKNKLDEKCVSLCGREIAVLGLNKRLKGKEEAHSLSHFTFIR